MHMIIYFTRWNHQLTLRHHLISKKKQLFELEKSLGLNYKVAKIGFSIGFYNKSQIFMEKVNISPPNYHLSDSAPQTFN